MDATTVAWLFPGQGSQAVGMGADLRDAHPLARQTLEEADDLLGFSLSRLMAEGPKEALDDTINTQPAIYVHSVALLRAARAEGRLPAAGWAAGHSLGEYSALTAVEALPFAEGLALVRERGRLMKAAGEQAPGAVAILVGLDDAAAQALCAEASAPGEPVQVANYNSPGQVVVSGAAAAVERAVAAAKRAGKAGMRMDVSVAVHSPLMEQARAAFEERVAAAPLRTPTLPVIANVSAQPMRSIADIRTELAAQLTGSVRWGDSMRFLRAQGVTTVIEIGPGSVLTGLMKRIDASVARHNLATWANVQAL